MIERLQGIDVSEWQYPGQVNFTPYDFVIIRSSYGRGAFDKYYREHAGAAEKAGCLLGFYHYAYPDTGNTAIDEADSFCMAVREYIGRCMLALDWEGAARDYPVSWMLDFLKRVQENTGVTPFVYMSASDAKKPKYNVLSDKYPLWVAHWETDYPHTGNWKKWVIWQHQGSPLDLDVFNGTKEDWKKYCGRGDTMTQQEFNVMMDNWIKEQAAKPEAAWAKAHIEAVKEAGVMVGDGKGSFKPKAPVTREELAAVAHNILSKIGSSDCCRKC